MVLVRTRHPDASSPRKPHGTFHALMMASANQAFFLSITSRSTIMTTLLIKDLAVVQTSNHAEAGSTRSLTRAEMRRVQGGRAIAVLVDGRPGGVVDDFQLQMAIFKGDIGVRVV
jgi:hypothetical protein